MPRTARKWTTEEDDLLFREVHAQLVGGKVKDWTVIADKISGRTNKDCRKRWHNVLSGGFNKGYWTKEEDKLLTRAVQTYGETWTAVADTVKTRSADQCAKRWKQCLDPQLDRSEWTEEDNRRLLEVAAMKGRRWKDIQLEHFPSRSRNAIKNQFTIISRREHKLRPVRSRSNAKPKDPPINRETELSTDSSSDDEDDDSDKNNYEEDEDGSTEKINRRDARNYQGDPSAYSSTSNSNPTPVNHESAIYAGSDALSWDNIIDGASDQAWNPAVPPDESTWCQEHGFDGTLSDLSIAPSNGFHEFGHSSSDATKQGSYPNLLSPAPTNKLGFLGLGDLEMTGVESHQPAIVPLQGAAAPCRNSRGSKVVLTVEEPDHWTVEALVQTAYLSGSPFHLARE